MIYGFCDVCGVESDFLSFFDWVLVCPDCNFLASRGVLCTCSSCGEIHLWQKPEGEDLLEDGALPRAIVFLEDCVYCSLDGVSC